MFNQSQFPDIDWGMQPRAGHRHRPLPPVGQREMTAYDWGRVASQRTWVQICDLVGESVDSAHCYVLGQIYNEYLHQCSIQNNGWHVFLEGMGNLFIAAGLATSAMGLHGLGMLISAGGRYLTYTYNGETYNLDLTEGWAEDLFIPSIIQQDYENVGSVVPYTPPNLTLTEEERKGNVKVIVGIIVIGAILWMASSPGSKTR